MSAAALKERLRGDLKAALQARTADRVRVLRVLIAALDNAEAVAVAQGPSQTGTRTFGDPSGEVARRELDRDAVDALLQAEMDARRSAAKDYDRHGRGEEAERLRAEALLIAAYRED